MDYDLGLSLDEIVRRLTSLGYSEDTARRNAEIYSVVFKSALDEPISRRYLDIHLELLENRINRRWDEFESGILERFASLEKLLGSRKDDT